MRALVSAVSLLLVLAKPVLARGGMPDPLTPDGKLIESLYFQIVIAGFVVFLLVFALLVVILWRFRERGGHGRATFEHERENHRLELLWFLGPLVLVAWIGWIAYGGLLVLDEGSERVEAELDGQDFSSDRVFIGITGMQYDWVADYGDGVSVSASPDSSTGEVRDENVFVVPEDRTITFDITSTDVIHSFYIQDSNGGPVGMVDANPGGPTEHNQLTIHGFPAGDYYVQCKEMCLNPGHAYMRARIQAVPQAEFDVWHQCLAAGVDPDREGGPGRYRLLQDVEVELGPGGLTSAAADNGTLTVVGEEGAAVRVRVTNNADQERTVEGGGAGITLGPGEIGCFTVPVPGPTTVPLTSDGEELTIEAVEAEVIDWELDEWFIEPPRTTLESGTTYLFRVRNTGELPHNLYVGAVTNGRETEVSSATIGGGQTTSFVWTPEETVTFDTWCDVPGHLEQGMQGVLTVQ